MVCLSALVEAADCAAVVAWVGVLVATLASVPADIAKCADVID